MAFSRVDIHVMLLPSTTSFVLPIIILRDKPDTKDQSVTTLTTGHYNLRGARRYIHMVLVNTALEVSNYHNYSIFTITAVHS